MYSCRAEEKREVRLNDLKIVVLEGVYDPSTDSFVLMNEAVENISEGPALEIGCGCGLASIALAKKGVVVTCVDISPCAVMNAYTNAKMNGVDGLVDVVQCDSGDCMRSGVFKAIIFNPPYLPIPLERCSGLMELSWCGGVGGEEVARKFLSNALRTCSKGCSILFVVSSLQSYGGLTHVVARRCGDVVLKWLESFFFERIGVVVASRCSGDDGRDQG